MNALACVHCKAVHITLSLRCGEQKRQNPPPVKYWKTALSIFTALSASLTLADDFRTIRGKEYKDATVSRVEPDGIVLRTKSGIVKLYFSELPKEVQGRFDHEGRRNHRRRDSPSNADERSKTVKTRRSSGEATKTRFAANRLQRARCQSVDSSCGLEKVRCTGEGEHDEEFGSLLSSAASVDLDSR